MISSWLWNSLPGPALVRLLILLVVIAAVVLALFEYVFPWVSEALGVQETTVEES
ncbi:hypothetical protein [Demequina sp. NBRC 110053]|uniref:hypothetical protein n=1 Tax=Demequina sp. NBRC 110053 TaxID=1570342 RepID=UPI0013565934|nr:hypothetical protein [Demequina sp. NBRC 110053]